MAKSCHLSRNYSIASLLGIVLVATALVFFYRHLATDALMEREGQANSDIARLLSNTLWPEYGDFLDAAADMPTPQLRLEPTLQSLRRDIGKHLSGLRVAKVKIYALDGRVLFSTQASQIGDDKSGNPGFQRAREGGVASEIIYRNQFSGFEKQLYDRNLVASYIPVRLGFDSPVIAVLEIYSDVTPLVMQVEQSSYRIGSVVFALMVLLYLFLLLLVRRADKMIHQHNRELKALQQERLSYLERHDELTGLYNRNGLLHTLDTAGRRHLGIDTALGVMSIKLLRFKELNDSLGHRIGDRVLQLVAERISACAPGGDAVARIDGGEFAIALENLLSDKEAEYVAAKLRGMFAEPLLVDGHPVTLSLAIGVCIADSRGYSTERLMMNAGTALQVAAHSPSRRFVMFDEALELEKQERFELEQELARAVAERQFVLHFQPRVSARSGQVVGMEALLRWQHPQRGLVMPGHFIELLEESGEIIQLGPWLLEEACRQCRDWQESAGEGLRVAVNVSLKQLFAEGFVQSVEQALLRSALPPESLELELTESILAEDKQRAGEVLHQLKRLGVVLSLDDFGTGYSSLSYLMHFPVDYLKIDRSFIRDIADNHEHAALTNAIIAMGKSLNMHVVAEGVETYEQLEFVQRMGCDELQGFYFSRAVPGESFHEVVDTIHQQTTMWSMPTVTRQ